MAFLNPWLLLGLAALAVPVLVHMVLREEHSGRKFPSLMFVRRIPFEIKRRRHIRDRALLALRCLALAALVLAFAAPDFGTGATAASPNASTRDVVVLIDRSYSMSHPARWRRAIEAAGERIDALAAGERAALVAFDDGATVVAELTDDKALLRGSLGSLEPGAGKTGYASAFGAANHMLARSSAPQREVVLISDLQQSALEDTGALPLGEDVALEIVPVTGPVGANVTVTDAKLAPRQDRGVEDFLLVRVENTGDAALAGGRLQLHVDGRLAATHAIGLAAGEAEEISLPLVLAADRPTRITLDVGPDALPADNRYHVVLAPRRPVAVAIIEPAHPRADLGVFIEQALRLSRTPPVGVRRVRLDDIDDARLAPFDVLVLDDVPVPPGAARDAISDFIARGGGVLAAAGPDTGAAWPGGPGGFLPGDLGPEITHGGHGSRVEVLAADHRLWASPGLERGGSLSAASIAASRELVPRPGDQVLARLDGGAALITERSSGAGRALALATTADPRWGNLALEPGFVPFAQAAVAYLAGRSGWIDFYLTGDVVALARLAGHLPDGADWRRYIADGGALVVETPSGGAQRIRPAAGAFFSARRPGLHEAHRADGRGQALPFAVNVARAESLLTPASPQQLEQRIVRRPRAAWLSRRGAAGAGDTDPFGAARWLLMLAALALIIESLVATRVSRRGPSPPKASVA